MIRAVLIGLVFSSTVLAADPFEKSNLVAWCIVPFDAKKRGPEERVEMLARLGITKYAYDWRAEHLPAFEREVELLKKHKIELTAVWFPGMNADGRKIMDVLKKHEIKTQLWVMAGVKDTDDQAKKVETAAALVKTTAVEAAKIGCTVGLYNHGAWYGEPENQIAIIERLGKDGITNVGIVYNQHHGHDHVDRFAELLAKMKPHLYCLNLNGMAKGGDKAGKKILPIGLGELDERLLKVVRESGYGGPIGILNHTDHDAEVRLLDNLEGLAWVVSKVEGKAAAEPKWRTK